MGRSGQSGRFRILLALAALAAQLGAICDALFVQHVTCPVDGERVHLTAGTEPSAPRSIRSSRIAPPAGADADAHEHGQCLVDDDVDCVPPPAAAPAATPQLRSASAPWLALARPAFVGAPLYRLAPKNSPPKV